MGAILDQMIRNARQNNGNRQLPYPQDVKVWLRKNEHLRVSIAWWPKDKEGLPDMVGTDPRLVSCKRHYVLPEMDPTGQGGGYFLCQGQNCQMCKSPDENLSQPRAIFGTVVVAWPTDSRGNLNRDAWKRQIFDVMPWVFGQQVLSTIQQVQPHYPLGMHDLTLTCEDPKFQRIQVAPCKDNLLHKILTAAVSPNAVKGLDPAKATRGTGWLSAIIQRVDTMTPVMESVMALSDISTSRIARPLDGSDKAFPHGIANSGGG